MVNIILNESETKVKPANLMILMLTLIAGIVVFAAFIPNPDAQGLNLMDSEEYSNIEAVDIGFSDSTENRTQYVAVGYDSNVDVWVLDENASLEKSLQLDLNNTVKDVRINANGLAALNSNSISVYDLNGNNVNNINDVGSSMEYLSANPIIDMKNNVDTVAYKDGFNYVLDTNNDPIFAVNENKQLKLGTQEYSFETHNLIHPKQNSIERYTVDGGITTLTEEINNDYEIGGFLFANETYTLNSVFAFDRTDNEIEKRFIPPFGSGDFPLDSKVSVENILSIETSEKLVAMDNNNSIIVSDYKENSLDEIGTINRKPINTKTYDIGSANYSLRENKSFNDRSIVAVGRDAFNTDELRIYNLDSGDASGVIEKIVNWIKYIYGEFINNTDRGTQFILATFFTLAISGTLGIIFKEGIVVTSGIIGFSMVFSLVDGFYPKFMSLIIAGFVILYIRMNSRGELS